MASPPKSLTPEQLWAELTALPRPSRNVPFPRRRADGSPFGEVAIVPLTQAESQAATLATERWVTRFMKEERPSKDSQSIGYETLYETRATLEILFRCTKQPGDLAKSFFPNVDAIGTTLTTDEVAVLFRAYTLVRSEVGPIAAAMSEDEFQAWIEVLGKGGSAYPLASLTLGLQIELLQRMASALCTLQTGKSSPGTQPDEPT